MREEARGGAGGRRSRVREKFEAAYRAAAPDGAEGEVRDGDAAWQLLEALPGALVLLSTDRRVLFWDDRARETLGWTEQEVMGEVAPFVHPEEWTTFGRDFEELLDGVPIAGWEVRVVGADGSTVPCEVWARRVDAPGGEPVGVVFVLLDVRHREDWRRRHEASERRFQELLRHNVAGVFRSRRDGTLLDCNERLAEILGYESAEELEGTDVARLYPSPARRAEYIERLREERRLVNHELELVRRDGSPVRVLESSVLLEDAETGQEEIVGSVIEVAPPPRRRRSSMTA